MLHRIKTWLGERRERKEMAARIVELEAEVEALKGDAMHWTNAKAEAAEGKGYIVEAAAKGYLMEFIGEMVRQSFIAQGAQRALGANFTFKINGYVEDFGPFEIMVRKTNEEHPLDLLHKANQELAKIKKHIFDYDGDDVADQVEKEMHDFKILIENVPKVYEHVTGFQASKHLTDPDVIIKLHDDHVNKRVEEAVKEALQEEKELNDHFLDKEI